MRLVYFYIVVGLLFTSCKKGAVERPIWLNDSPTVRMPDAVFSFKASGKKWDATLLGFVQPMGLSLQYNDSGFTARLEKASGIIESPAQLCLSFGKEHFYYSLSLVNNNSVDISKRDYRSPKTVNPDSSLMQQRIIHYIDEYRNLSYFAGTRDCFSKIKYP